MHKHAKLLMFNGPENPGIVGNQSRKYRDNASRSRHSGIGIPSCDFLENGKKTAVKEYEFPIDMAYKILNRFQNVLFIQLCP